MKARVRMRRVRRGPWDPRGGFRWTGCPDALDCNHCHALRGVGEAPLPRPPHARILLPLMTTTQAAAVTSKNESFAIDLSAMKPLKLDPSRLKLTADEKAT